MGPEALYQITGDECKTEQDSIKRKNLIQLFNQYYCAKRNTYHNRGDFRLAKLTGDETTNEFWRRLIAIEKEMNINTTSAEKTLISTIKTAITDKQLRDKVMKQTMELNKKTVDIFKQTAQQK